MKSNDSPEIPSIGETSDAPGLPSGLTRGVEITDTDIQTTTTTTTTTSSLWKSVANDKDVSQ